MIAAEPQGFPKDDQRGAVGRIGRSVARRLLSAYRTPSAQARRRRSARSHPKDRARQPPLRRPPHRSGAPAPGPERQRQAGAQANARGQPPEPARQAFPPDRRHEPTRVRRRPQPDARASFPPGSIRSGSPTSPTCGSPRASSIWRRSSTPSRAKVVGWALADPLEASLGDRGARHGARRPKSAVGQPHPPLSTKACRTPATHNRSASKPVRSPPA